MEVKKYQSDQTQKTELGPIPSDWRAVRFDDVLTGFASGATPYRGRPEYYKGNIRWITSGELNYNTITDTIEKITEEAVRNTNLKMLPVGTFLMAITGLEAAGTRGSCGIVGKESTTNQSCMALLPKNGAITTEFLYHFYVKYGDELAFRYCQGTKQQSYTGKIVKILPINLPPTLSEQRAIATALSDTDALIAALDRLIAKKKAIKQGAMQELLTGGRRLEGFSGAWRFFKLGNNSIIKARIGWQGLTTAEYLDFGDYILITGTDFLDGSIYWNGCNYVAQKRYAQDVNIQVKPGDVLVTKDGTIGKIAYVSTLPKPATLNSGVFVIRPVNDAYLSRFFYYILASPYFEDFLRKLSAGSTISHLYQKDFVHFEFPLPPTSEEQRAIAQILTDMDAEIATLEQQRDKYKAVKQGMMQELLTGKTRLI